MDSWLNRAPENSHEVAVHGAAYDWGLLERTRRAVIRVLHGYPKPGFQAALPETASRQIGGSGHPPCPGGEDG